jgi:hypothetical protein
MTSVFSAFAFLMDKPNALWPNLKAALTALGLRNAAHKVVLSRVHAHPDNMTKCLAMENTQYCAKYFEQMSCVQAAAYATHAELTSRRRQKRA